jgi:rubredoxin
MLTCPQCAGSQLEVRRRVGFERFLALFTQKRKYRCILCSFFFRAADRRATPRDENSDNVKGATQRADARPDVTREEIP